MKTSQGMGCTVTDEWSYRGMKVIFMENDWLRIGVLADRGGDIFEFRYKPQDIDPLLRLPKGIRNPRDEQGQFANASGRFEDYYYGGWQELLPNSPVFNYRGAMLGMHGELSLKPWKYAILENHPGKVAIKLWAELLRMPLKIEKILTLTKDEPRLYIAEELTNSGNTHLDIMWGHHIAFGLPFLERGAHIETNAQWFIAEPMMPEKRRFKPGNTFNWPHGVSLNGTANRADIIPDREAPAYSELCYLSGYDSQAFYTLYSLSTKLGFDLRWSGELFKHLWLWQERFASYDFPWWGQCYAVALEPWTSAWTADPEGAIARKDWLRIEAGGVISTELSAGIVERDQEDSE